MSTVGGYLEYRGGCSVPWGDIMINVVLNTPTVLKISPTVLMISPHGTEHPHGTLYRVGWYTYSHSKKNQRKHGMTGLDLRTWRQGKKLSKKF